MPSSYQDNLDLARNLATHIRRCCTALVDGTIKLPRYKPAFWAARIDNSAKHWRYPIVTPAIRKDCAALGIEIGDEIQRLSGVQQLSAFLKSVEEPITGILSDVPAMSTSISVAKALNPDGYLEPRVRRLPAIFAPIQAQDSPGVSLFLHGSMADLQYTPFSDVDDLVVLRRTAWQDPASLMNTATLLAQVGREYQNVDPLQHHGHWVLTEFDLLLYDQSYMPLVVLDEAVRIVGKPQINCRIDHDHAGFITNARNTIQSMNKALAKATREGGLNAFELKGLVGEIAIMPAYLFQARGEMLPKPQAIGRAGELYSPRALQALEWATMVREEFGPLLHNRRTRMIGTVANWTCTRRQHAENLFRKHAVWVSNKHPLGLNAKVVAAIEAFMQESGLSVTELAG